MTSGPISARRPVVLVSGMPRSGTTWVSQLFAVHAKARLKFCPLFSYEFKGRCDATSSPEQWRAMFDEVYSTHGEFLDQEHIRRTGAVPDAIEEPSPPRLVIKSNRFHDLTPSMLEALPELSVIGLVRDPVGCLVSWMTNPTEFRAPCDPVRDWRTGGCRKTQPGEFWGFDDWLQVAAQFVALAERYPGRVHVHRTGDIRRNPVVLARAILAEAGLSPTLEVLAFVEESRTRHSDDPRSVYRRHARAGRDAAVLPPGVAEQVREESIAAGLGRFVDLSKIAPQAEGSS